MKKLLLFGLLLISIAGCQNDQEALNDFDLVFIGSWSSDEYYIEIGANGYGFCQHRSRNDIDGWVEITRDEIIFRDDFDRERFFIDVEPYEDFGEIMMVLDDEVFYKH